MKNSVLKGSLILLIAGVVAKVFGAVYRIPLSNILGADGIGVYQMIFPIFSLFLIISSGGVSTTISHCVAKIRATNCGNEKKVFLQGFMFSLCSSVIFAIIFLLFSKNIAVLQGNVMASYGYKISAIALVFASLLAPFRGLYQGQQNMMPTAISQIIEQVAKVAFGLGFAIWFSKFGTEFGVCSAFMGVALSEVFAFIFLLLKTKKNHHFFVGVNPKNQNLNFWKTNFFFTFCVIVLPSLTAFDSLVVVNILDNFFPSTYATSLYGLQSGIITSLTAFDSLVVVNILDNFFSSTYATSLYGLQSGIITSLINFPVMMSVAISLALLPNLSGFVAKGQIEDASKNLGKVVEILFVILIPFVLVFVFFAKDILLILYPTLDANLLEIGTKLLQFSAINVLTISFLQVFVSVFQSFGQKAKTAVCVLLGCGIIKIASLITLTSNVNLNIFGVAFSNVMFYLLGALTLLMLLKNKVPILVNQKNLTVCFVSAFFVAISFFAINVYLDQILAKILIAGVLGILLYGLPMLMFGDFNIKRFFGKSQLKENVNE